MLFFNRDNQKRKYLNNLPLGRVFKQARKDGTDFNNFSNWIGSGFQWLVDRYNETFKGLFVCKSRFLIEEFKKDYSIPNEVFYETTVEEHIADVKVLKYLMKGNMAWHFQAIANAYDLCVEIRTGVEHFSLSQLPAKIPYRLYNIDDVQNINNILVIVFKGQSTTSLPYKLPHKLATSLKTTKLKRIYDKIKPAQTRILYVRESNSESDCEKIDICDKGATV